MRVDPAVLEFPDVLDSLTTSLPKLLARVRGTMKERVSSFKDTLFVTYGSTSYSCSCLWALLLSGQSSWPSVRGLARRPVQKFSMLRSLPLPLYQGTSRLK